MPHIQETHVTAMRVKQRRSFEEEKEAAPKSEVEWLEPCRKRRGEALLKNLCTASVLVLCAVTLRTGALPALSGTTDIIMTAATDHSLLDDQLGKLSFVSTLFPEAVLVFGETQGQTISQPVSGGVVVHTWSAAEPYMSWRSDSRKVVSASSGEVVGVYHGNGDERLVQVVDQEGWACLYGNLAQIHVQTGDQVAAGQVLGELQPGKDLVFELRQDGISIDPAMYMSR